MRWWRLRLRFLPTRRRPPRQTSPPTRGITLRSWPIADSCPLKRPILRMLSRTQVRQHPRAMLQTRPIQEPICLMALLIKTLWAMRFKEMHFRRHLRAPPTPTSKLPEITADHPTPPIPKTQIPIIPKQAMPPTLTTQPDLTTPATTVTDPLTPIAPTLTTPITLAPIRTIPQKTLLRNLSASSLLLTDLIKNFPFSTLMKTSF